MLAKNDGELKSPSIVKSISLGYNLSRLDMLDDTRQALIEQQQVEADDHNGNSLMEDEVSRGSDGSDRFSTIPKRVDFINDCSVILSRQFGTDNSFLFNLTHFIGYAFVSFQYQHYKTFFLEEYDRNSSNFIYNGQQLKIANAAHPNDILWSHFKTTSQEKGRRKINTLLLLTFVLLVSFLILLGFSYLLMGTYTSALPFSKYPFVCILISSIFLTFSNWVIRKIVKKLVTSEQHKTKINYCTSYLLKSVIAQFVNTAVFIV